MRGAEATGSGPGQPLTYDQPPAPRNYETPVSHPGGGAVRADSGSSFYPTGGVTAGGAAFGYDMSSSSFQEGTVGARVAKEQQQQQQRQGSGGTLLSHFECSFGTR
jgi:hypothetical protein